MQACSNAFTIRQSAAGAFKNLLQSKPSPERSPIFLRRFYTENSEPYLFLSLSLPLCMFLYFIIQNKYIAHLYFYLLYIKVQKLKLFAKTFFFQCNIKNLLIKNEKQLHSDYYNNHQMHRKEMRHKCKVVIKR